MKDANLRLIGALLLAAGAFVFLVNTGIFWALPAFIWFAFLLTVGAAFWFSTPSLPFWGRVVGFVLIGVFAISTSGRFAGSAALAFPALAFALLYLDNPKRWWAVLPAGVLGSVGALVTTEVLFGWGGAPVLFLGFAATFAYLYLLPKERGGQRWALYPTLVSIILTVIVNDPSGRTPGWVLPLLLTGGGAFILWWWRDRR